MNYQDFSAVFYDSPAIGGCTMKKFLSVMFLVTILIFSTNNFASAQDIYCGTQSNGMEAYLVTESIKAKYFRKDVIEIKCNVKVVSSGKIVELNAYQFIWDDGWKYSSGGRPVKLTENNTIAWNVFINAKKYC